MTEPTTEAELSKLWRMGEIRLRNGNTIEIDFNTVEPCPSCGSPLSTEWEEGLGSWFECGKCGWTHLIDGWFERFLPDYSSLRCL